MAPAAGRSEPALVNIGMTTVTIGKGDPFKLLELYPVAQGNRMALAAGYALVTSLQRIPGIGMVEFSCRLEAYVAVTIAAGASEGLLMVVGMAGGTVRREPQVGELLFPDSRIGDELLFMAVVTSL